MRAVGDGSIEPWRGWDRTKLRPDRLRSIEDFIAVRASACSRSANNELEFLNKVLRDARGRGHRIDERVLAIPAISHTPRRGRALTVDRL